MAPGHAGDVQSAAEGHLQACKGQMSKLHNYCSTNREHNRHITFRPAGPLRSGLLQHVPKQDVPNGQETLPAQQTGSSLWCKELPHHQLPDYRVGAVPMSTVANPARCD